MSISTEAALTVDPERHFVGCLLCLQVGDSRRVLAGMRADDLAEPTSAHVLQLVIELVAADTPPAPVAVYSHAVATGRAPGEHQRHQLSLWLAETYEAVQLPLLAGHLKAVVLEAAWRRTVAEHAERLLQAVADSPTDVLATLAEGSTAAEQLWARYQAATAVIPAPRSAVLAGDATGGHR